jgi:hypothetical protein
MLIDIGEFQRLLAQKGLQIVEQENRSLPAGKVLWFGIFSQGSGACVLYRTRPHLSASCRRESSFCGRMVERPRQLPAAIDVTRRVSAHLDQGNAPDWIETALTDGVPGVQRWSIIPSCRSICRMLIVRSSTA